MAEDILLVKIHNAIDKGKDYYEATRGNWKINKRRLKHIQYVVGIHRGKVLCAYVPKEWHIIAEGDEVGRKIFVGKEASNDIIKRLQDVEGMLLGRFGFRQSIAYISMADIIQ